jgi:hypothetical protein
MTNRYTDTEPIRVSVDKMPIKPIHRYPSLEGIGYRLGCPHGGSVNE